MVNEGAVMEQRQGWERPAWYLKDGTAPILPYDYYGNYGSKKNESHKYEEILSQDHTFNFPVHHENVR
jgi:sarcosine dehydrogenase